MHELGHDREVARRGRRRAEARRRQEHRERSNALAAGLEQVRRGLRRGRQALAHETRQLTVDDRHVRPEHAHAPRPGGRRRDRPARSAASCSSPTETAAAAFVVAFKMI